MSNAPTIVEILKPETIERVILQGDLERLTSGERLSYYKAVCESVGLNPLTKPFDYIKLNGALRLYANKGCAEQLRQRYQISVFVTSREKIGEDVYVVTARAKFPDGREDESTGAVTVANLKGDALANAMMKAETKAKRRVTLSICGLNMLDETEAVTIEGAEVGIPQSLIETPSPAPGDFVITIGKKFKGMKIKDCDRDELDKYLDWYKSDVLTGNPAKNRAGRGLTAEETDNMVAFGRYLNLLSSEGLNEEQAQEEQDTMSRLHDRLDEMQFNSRQADRQATQAARAERGYK